MSRPRSDRFNWSAWDSEPCENAGHKQTENELERFNKILRIKLQERFGDFNKRNVPDEEIESFIEDNWMDWFPQVIAN